MITNTDLCMRFMDLLSFLQDEMTPASYADLFSETFQRHPLLCLWGMLPQPNYTATESVDPKRLCHPAPKLFPAMHAVKCFHHDMSTDIRHVLFSYQMNCPVS